MKRSIPFSTFVVAFVAFSVSAVAQPLDGPFGDGTGVHAIELPKLGPDATAPREETKLLKTPRLTIVRIVLRKKTILPSHASGAHLVLQALVGQATIRAAGKTINLDPRHLVVLAPNVAHEVTPVTDVVELLVFHQAWPTRRGRGPR